MSDPLVYPGTNVLINRFGIRDQKKLDRAETLYSSQQMLRPITPTPELTPEGYAQIHKHILAKVYPWAGEIRKTNIVKMAERGRAVEFEQGALIRPNMQRVFAELAEDNFLRGLDKDTFAYRAAVYMEDFNFIHPFREGNGRTQRVFLELLAQQAGHQLDRSLINPDHWIQGAVQSYRQPVHGLHDIMTATIRGALVDPPRDRSKDAARLAAAGISWDTQASGKQVFSLLKDDKGKTLATIRELARPGKDGATHEVKLHSGPVLKRLSRHAGLQEARGHAEAEILGHLHEQRETEHGRSAARAHGEGREGALAHEHARSATRGYGYSRGEDE